MAKRTPSEYGVLVFYLLVIEVGVEGILFFGGWPALLSAALVVVVMWLAIFRPRLKQRRILLTFEKIVWEWGHWRIPEEEEIKSFWDVSHSGVEKQGSISILRLRMLWLITGLIAGAVGYYCFGSAGAWFGAVVASITALLFTTALLDRELSKPKARQETTPDDEDAVEGEDEELKPPAARAPATAPRDLQIAFDGRGVGEEGEAAPGGERSIFDAPAELTEGPDTDLESSDFDLAIGDEDGEEEEQQRRSEGSSVPPASGPDTDFVLNLDDEGGSEGEDGGGDDEEDEDGVSECELALEDFPPADGEGSGSDFDLSLEDAPPDEEDSDFSEFELILDGWGNLALPGEEEEKEKAKDIFASTFDVPSFEEWERRQGEGGAAAGSPADEPPVVMDDRKPPPNPQEDVPDKAP